MECLETISSLTQNLERDGKHYWKSYEEVFERVGTEGKVVLFLGNGLERMGNGGGGGLVYPNPPKLALFFLYLS